MLQAEYHASSIRLRRVLLLRSVIRLTPSDICFASLWRMEYHWSRKALISLSQGENITLTIVSISLNKQKEREDSLIYESSLFCLCGFGLPPKCICAYKCDAGSYLVLTWIERIFKSSAKDITLFLAVIFIKLNSKKPNQTSSIRLLKSSRLPVKDESISL